MRHVYVHVPFCARRCVYCDFAIAVRKSVPADRFVEAVVRELTYRLEAGELSGGPTETLYFGGGTPSLLPAPQIGTLAGRLLAGGLAADPEITLEANPDDVSSSAVTAWIRAGVNRVSLGVQSFDPRVLSWMHRTHAAQQSAQAVRTLRRAGIGNVSLDLIFALPPELDTDFAADLRQAVALDPDHLSVYGLTVEPRTPLARWISRGATTGGSDDRYAEQFLAAHEFLVANGYEHYEVSNYARGQRRSQHNSAYWSGRPYVGLGPSAHSYQDGERRWNLAPWRDYERAVMATGEALAGKESLTDRQVALERAYLGLRTSAGLDRCTAQFLNPDTLREAGRQGWLREGRERLSLTAPGWLRLDELAVALTTSAEGG